MRGSSNGKTSGCGPVNRGSTPRPLSPRRLARRTRQLVTLVRNVWFLRGELWDIYVRRRHGTRRGPIELHCLRCRRPLTKPCRPASRAHVFAWPEEMPHPDFEAGQLVYVRQTHGSRRAELRSQPF